MLALLFTILLIAALIMSAGTIIGTWRQYGSAWDALNAEMAHPAPRRIMTIRVIERPASIFAHEPSVFAHDPRSCGYDRSATITELKTKSLAFAQRREWRAAA